MTEYVTKDSGQRISFDTGARRDMNAGKGRFDLLPPYAMIRLSRVYCGGDYPATPVAVHEAAYRTLAGERDRDWLALACAGIIDLMGGWWPGIRRLADLYERGAVKYDARNWEKGIPAPRMLESGMRHFTQAMGGEDDEDHYAAVLWNLLGVAELEERLGRGMTQYAALGWDELGPLWAFHAARWPKAHAVESMSP